MSAFRFAVRASADPGLVPRLVNHFAQRGLVPSRLGTAMTGAELEVVIEQPGLSEDQATLIAERMRASILVGAVELAPCAGA